MKKYVVGDIHGFAKSLEKLLKDCDFDFENDLLIQIGDVCDRGPQSYEVIETLLTIKNLILIQGNYDMWLKDWLNKRPFDIYNWFNNGGYSTSASYQFVLKEDKEKHIELLNKQVPYYIDDQNRCFVHAGFDRNFLIEGQDEITLCWDRELVKEMIDYKRDENLYTKNNFSEVFIGHTPTILWSEDEILSGAGIIVTLDREGITTPIHKGGIWNIDTGCGKKGMLTLMNIDTKEYWQAYEIY